MPFRRLPHVPPGRLLATVGAVTLGAALLSVGGWVMAAQVWKPAYESGSVWVAHPVSADEEDAEARAATPGVTCEWSELAAYIGDNGQCRQSTPGTEPDVVLLGDSHAAHLFPGLYEALPGRNVAVATFQSPYMFGTPLALDLVLDSILSAESKPTVVISRYWTRGGMSPADQLEPLRHAVSRLTEGGAEVVLVDDVPDFPFPVSSCGFRLAPVIATAVCDQPREGVDAGREPYLDDLRRVAAQHPGTRVVEVGTALCSENTCSMLSGDRVAYSDADHINVVGSRVVAERLVEAAYLDRPVTGRG